MGVTVSNKEERGHAHTGGLLPARKLARSLVAFPSFSPVATRLVRTYPQTRVVVLDTMDYCASARNLEEASGRDNFRFVKGDGA